MDNNVDRKTNGEDNDTFTVKGILIREMNTNHRVVDGKVSEPKH